MKMKILIISVSICALTLGCSADSPKSVPKESSPSATNVHESVIHAQKMPVTTTEQLQALESRLKEIGFKAGWFKDGPNLSGYSLVGRYDNVDFRFSVVHRRSSQNGPETISVSMEAQAPSRKEAEDASRKLSSYLEQEEKNGQPEPERDGLKSAR
jgi:hypothetical protein